MDVYGEYEQREELYEKYFYHSATGGIIVEAQEKEEEDMATKTNKDETKAFIAETLSDMCTSLTEEQRETNEFLCTISDNMERVERQVKNVVSGLQGAVAGSNEAANVLRGCGTDARAAKEQASMANTNSASIIARLRDLQAAVDKLSSKAVDEGEFSVDYQYTLANTPAFQKFQVYRVTESRIEGNPLANPEVKMTGEVHECGIRELLKGFKQNKSDSGSFLRKGHAFQADYIDVQDVRDLVAKTELLQKFYDEHQKPEKKHGVVRRIATKLITPAAVAAAAAAGHLLPALVF